MSLVCINDNFLMLKKGGEREKARKGKKRKKSKKRETSTDNRRALTQRTIEQEDISDKFREKINELNVELNRVKEKKN